MRWGKTYSGCAFEGDVAVWLPGMMMLKLTVFWFIVVVRSNYEMTVLWFC